MGKRSAAVLLFLCAIHIALVQAGELGLSSHRLPAEFGKFYLDVEWQQGMGVHEVAGLRVYPPNSQNLLKELRIGEMEEIAQADFEAMLLEGERSEYAKVAAQLGEAKKYREEALGKAAVAQALAQRAANASLDIPQEMRQHISIAGFGVPTGVMHYAFVAAGIAKVADFLAFALHYGAQFEGAIDSYFLALKNADEVVNGAVENAESTYARLEFSGMCSPKYNQGRMNACANWSSFVQEVKLGGGKYAAARNAMLSMREVQTFLGIGQVREVAAHEGYNSLVGENGVLLHALALQRESAQALLDAENANAQAQMRHGELLGKAQGELKEAQAQQYWRMGTGRGFESSSGEVGLSDALSYYERMQAAQELCEKSELAHEGAISAHSSKAHGYLLESLNSHADGSAYANAALLKLSQLKEGAGALLQKARERCALGVEGADANAQGAVLAEGANVALARAKIAQAKMQLLEAAQKNSGQAYEEYVLACDNAKEAVLLLKAKGAVGTDAQLVQTLALLEGAKKDGLDVAYEEGLHAAAKAVLEGGWADEESVLQALELLKSVREGVLAKENALLQEWQPRYAMLLGFGRGEIAGQLLEFSSLYAREGKLDALSVLGKFSQMRQALLRIEGAALGERERIVSQALSQNAKLEVVSHSIWIGREGRLQGRVSTKNTGMDAADVYFFVPSEFGVSYFNVVDAPAWLGGISYYEKGKMLRVEMRQASANAHYAFYFEKEVAAPSVSSYSSIVLSNEGGSIRARRNYALNAQWEMQGVLYAQIPEGAVVKAATLGGSVIGAQTMQQGASTVFYAPVRLQRGENSLEVEYALEDAFEAGVSEYRGGGEAARIIVSNTVGIRNVKDSLEGALLFFEAPAGMEGFEAREGRAGTLKSAREGAHGGKYGYFIEIGKVQRGEEAQFFISYSLGNVSYVQQFILERERVAQAGGDAAALAQLEIAWERLSLGDVAGALEAAGRVQFGTLLSDASYDAEIASIEAEIHSMNASLAKLAATSYWKENALAQKLNEARSMLGNMELSSAKRAAKARGVLMDARSDVSALQQRLEKAAAAYAEYPSGSEANSLLLLARRSLLLGDAKGALEQCSNAALLLWEAQKERERAQAEEGASAQALVAQSGMLDAQIGELLAKYTSEYEDAKAARLGGVFPKTPADVKSEFAAIERKIEAWKKQGGNASWLAEAVAAKNSTLSYMRESLERLSQQSNSTLRIAQAGVGQLQENAKSMGQKERLEQLEGALSSAQSLHEGGKYAQSIGAAAQVAKNAANALSAGGGAQDETGLFVAAVSFVLALGAIAFLVFGGRKKGENSNGMKKIASVGGEEADGLSEKKTIEDATG